MTNVRTALVIGGGIAGPVAAMALRRAGIEATVYEAYDGTADGVGGGLGLAPNGLAAFGIVGLDEAVRRIGTPAKSMLIQSWTGKKLAEFRDPAGAPILHTVMRTDLYRVLYDGAAAQGIRIEHGKRLVDAREGADGVTAHFADGSRASADILIGADGIRSTVRSLIDPAAPEPAYTGLLGFGGWSAAPGLAPDPDTMRMIFGKRAFFAYTAFDDGRAGWFANLPRREPMTVGQARAVDPREWLAVLGDTFAEDRTPAPAILRSVDPDELVVVGGMEILPPVPTWSRGRLVLVGDSVHAPSASSGQGASLAVESAVQLARCLRDLPTVPEAFAAYEGLRRTRVERIAAAAARTNGNKAAGPVARVVRDLVLPVAMKLLAKPEKTAWQYGYRIDWDAPVGAAELSAQAA